VIDDANLPAPDPRALVEELRQLLGLRSRQSLRDRTFPELFTLLADEDRATPDRRFAALTRLLDDAIAAIDDPAHRHAAAALVGSGPGRWRTVTQRGTDAASAFGCGWDAYRRKRASGTSQLDDTLDALGAALSRGRADPSSPAPIQEPGHPAPPVATVVIGPAVSDGPGIEVDAVNPAERHRHGSRRDVITIGLVILAVVAGAAVAWLVSRPDPTTSASGPRHAEAAGDGDDEADDDQPASCIRLTNRVGDVGPAADDELRRWAPVFRAAAPDLPAGVDTCAGVLTHEMDLVLQPVSDGTPQGIGALVAVDGEPPGTVFLHHSEYWTYRTYVLAFGTGIGPPLARADRADGTWLVKLGQGAIVGGPKEPARLVFGVVFATWTDRDGVDGEMGLPVSQLRDVPGTGKVQDFQHGRVTIDYLDPTRVTWEPVANPAGLLPLDSQDRVLVADDGSSWWVDQDGIRHWIPTQNDFGCAGALGGTPEAEVPIIAIATLEIGEPFRCR
jgi:hypothetical protein